MCVSTNKQKKQHQRTTWLNETKTKTNNFKPILKTKTKHKGRKRRIGFGKKGKNSFTVHRSEEVLPGELRAGALSRGSSASSDGEGSIDVDRFDKIHHKNTTTQPIEQSIAILQQQKTTHIDSSFTFSFLYTNVFLFLFLFFCNYF